VLKKVSLSSLQRFMDLKTVAGIDGVLSRDAKIGSQAGKLTASGTMNLAQARKQGIEIGFPMAATYNLSADLTSQVLRIEKEDLTLGKTPISITGLVNTRPDSGTWICNSRPPTSRSPKRPACFRPLAWHSRLA
jgi:hypothetical protein